MSKKKFVLLIYWNNTNQWKDSFTKKAFTEQKSWLFPNVKLFLTTLINLGKRD
jgi:hypothetical protein